MMLDASKSENTPYLSSPFNEITLEKISDSDIKAAF